MIARDMTGSKACLRGSLSQMEVTADLPMRFET